MYPMTNSLLICVGRAALALLACLWLLPPAASCQDSAEQGTSSRGSRAEIAVTVRDKSGRQIITAPTVVKLYKNGALEDQRSTSQGRAFFIPRGLGEFNVAVETAGYKAAQQEVSITVAVQYQEDVYLERDATSGDGTGAPGRAVLAPKAKEALDKGAQGLKEGKLEEAQKYISEAMRLAPGNPDVLYVQGMLYMRQSNWERAQTTLEKASRMDPNQPRLLAALGMSLVNGKKFAEAIPLLEKSIQLQPASGWEAKWALAKAYYYREQYEQALKMANQAHVESRASSAQAELLLAQCLTAMGRYEDSAQVLREFLKYNATSPDAATARHWLERLTADGKIHQ
jgi:tetratricopeptide (TPR) repeat protein